MGPDEPKKPGDDDPYEPNELDIAVQTVMGRADDHLLKPACRIVQNEVGNAALEFLQELGEALTWSRDEDE